MASNLSATPHPPPPALPEAPFAFVLHFIRFYLPGVLGVALLEAGQSTCGILLPYAIKQIMDAVMGAQAAAADAWARSRGRCGCSRGSISAFCCARAAAA